MFIGANVECLVKITARLQDAGDLTLGDGQCMYVTEAFEHWQLFIGANAECLVKITARLQDVGDLALGDGQ